MLRPKLLDNNIYLKREGALQSQARTEIELRGNCSIRSQESLSIEIRNGTLETGNWTEVGEDGRLEMGNGKRGKWTLDGHKHNECELTESNSAFYQL